jgi:ABC-type lipoprotein export system ATPase subunit
MEPFVRCDGLVKLYQLESLEVFALQGLDLAIRRGEMVGIVGASGSGKSTLMQIVGGLDKPTAGQIWVDGRDLLKLNSAAQDRYRSAKVGFVWQQGIRNLVPYLNAEENVILTAVLAGVNASQAKQRARELLELVGLTKRHLHRLDELSGGEQQRVAIAVGLVNRPELLLADEPTGEVDTATSTGIYKIFRDLNKNYGMTIVIVSHDTSISKYVDRVVSIRDGKIASETVRIEPTEPIGAGTSSEDTHPEVQLEEVLVLDSAGRLQLPREYLDQLKIKNRVKIELREGGILILPVSEGSPPGMKSDEEPKPSADKTPLGGSFKKSGGASLLKSVIPILRRVHTNEFITRITNHFSSWPWHQWLVLALVMVYLLPIWMFQYIPTQDGPSHLYNSQILAWYFNPSSNFRLFYNLSPILFPNWLTYIILAPLMLIVPALIAEKILLSIYVALVPLSVWYLLDSIHYKQTLLTLACFGLIYNYLFLMGFYNFVFSIPLVLITIGYWWKHRERIGWREIIVINLLCVIIWFGHIVGYAIALFAIGLLALLQIRKGGKTFLKTMVCILPSTVLFINYYLGSNIAGAPEIDLSRVSDLLINLLKMKVLVSYDAVQEYIAYSVAVLFALMLVYTIWTKLRGKGKWIDRFTYSDSILLLVLCLLVLYLILPWSMGPGGWLNDRFALLICLLLLTWFVEGKQKSWRIGFAVLATCIALVNVGYIFFAFNHFNSGLREYTSGTKVIEKGKVILPFFFDGYGDSERVGIYVNAANYYALDNGGINLGNYEVQFDYFPIKFNNRFIPPVDDTEWVQTIHWHPQNIDICEYAVQIDYLETWGKADPFTTYDLRRCYWLLFENGRQRIYVPNEQYGE